MHILIGRSINILCIWSIWLFFFLNQEVQMADLMHSTWSDHKISKSYCATTRVKIVSMPNVYFGTFHKTWYWSWLKARKTFFLFVHTLIKDSPHRLDKTFMVCFFFISKNLLGELQNMYSTKNTVSQFLVNRLIIYTYNYSQLILSLHSGGKKKKKPVKVVQRERVHSA